MHGGSRLRTDLPTIVGKRSSRCNETAVDIELVVHQACLMTPAATDILIWVTDSLLE